MIVLALTALASLGAASAPQGGGPPATPWKKTCSMGVQGSEGCEVTVEMRISPMTPCTPGCEEYCVKVTVKCPANIPPEDPGEECTSAEDCELCCSATRGVSVICDGQTFEAKPDDSTGKDWGDVAEDCGDLEVTAS